MLLKTFIGSCIALISFCSCNSKSTVGNMAGEYHYIYKVGKGMSGSCRLTLCKDSSFSYSEHFDLMYSSGKGVWELKKDTITLMFDNPPYSIYEALAGGETYRGTWTVPVIRRNKVQVKNIILVKKLHLTKKSSCLEMKKND